MPEEARGWRLAGDLVRDRRWLLGQAVWVVAFVLQALARHLGRLSVVQPILVTQLVFTLVIHACSPCSPDGRSTCSCSSARRAPCWSRRRCTQGR